MRRAFVVSIAFAIAASLASVAMAQSFQATINGAQEVPPSGSSGIGLGCFSLGTNSMLSYEISFSGLSAAETGAHIHGPAAAGANAGVVFPLPAGSPKVGMLGPLNAAQIADLNAGLYYVNIHSAAFPGGEIRGQVLLVAEPCTVAIEESAWSTIKRLFRDED